jgi:hypothetical protein
VDEWIDGIDVCTNHPSSHRPTRLSGIIMLILKSNKIVSLAFKMELYVLVTHLIKSLFFTFRDLKKVSKYHFLLRLIHSITRLYITGRKLKLGPASMDYVIFDKSHDTTNILSKVISDSIVNLNYKLAFWGNVRLAK